MSVAGDVAAAAANATCHSNVYAHTYTCLWLIILGKSISQLARWLLIIILIVFWLIFGIIMWFRVATAATEIPKNRKTAAAAATAGAHTASHHINAIHIRFNGGQ